MECAVKYVEIGVIGLRIIISCKNIIAPLGAYIVTFSIQYGMSNLIVILGNKWLRGIQIFIEFREKSLQRELGRSSFSLEEVMEVIEVVVEEDLVAEGEAKSLATIVAN